VKVICPTCGRSGSLYSTTKGPQQRRKYFRVEHSAGKLSRERHYVPLEKALALTAAYADAHREEAGAHMTEARNRER
jgi:hypothetical protein